MLGFSLSTKSVGNGGTKFDSSRNSQLWPRETNEKKVVLTPSRQILPDNVPQPTHETNEPLCSPAFSGELVPHSMIFVSKRVKLSHDFTRELNAVFYAGVWFQSLSLDFVQQIRAAS